MAESFSNSLISNTIFYLLNFERYPSFQVALHEAAINNNFQVALFSEEFNRIFAVETRHIITVEEVVKARIDQNVSDFTRSVLGGAVDLTTFWRPITIGNEKYYLLLVDNDGNFSSDDLSKLSEIIQLAMGMWNYAPSRDTISEFVSAVRRGNRSLAHVLLEELKCPEKKLCGVYLIPGVGKEDALKILLDFEEKHGFSSYKQVESDEIAGVIVRENSAAEYSSEEWNDLVDVLTGAGASKCYCYFGTEGIEGVCHGFKTINETERVVPLIFPLKQGYSKYEMALAANCVNICMSTGVVKTDYQQLLKPLCDSTDLKSKQLMETLEVFILDSGISTIKTSKILNVHANTIQYRMKHIKELLCVDLTDYTIIPGLTTALAIRRIDKGVRSN